jgi:RHS repeat-associated protein
MAVGGFDGVAEGIFLLPFVAAVWVRLHPAATLTTTSEGGNGIPQNPYLFTRGIQDRTTGWVHYGARWYNPTTGRWTQQDTLGNPHNPTNANRYARTVTAGIENGTIRARPSSGRVVIPQRSSTDPVRRRVAGGYQSGEQEAILLSEPVMSYTTKSYSWTEAV